MKTTLPSVLLFLSLIRSAAALQMYEEMETSIGFFDACKQTFSYGFFQNKDYDLKTTLKTSGTFGALYPFKAVYHAFGSYQKQILKPQDYSYETHSAFNHRTKEIVYKDGIPQYRISTKGNHKRKDDIIIDKKYDSSIDLLSTVALLTDQILRNNNCEFDKYSFNGKKYSRSVIKNLGKEEIKTPYFEGSALKCEYHLQVLKDADAGFLLKKDEPIYFWVLRNQETGAPFVAKVLVENTPFGTLESIATKVEVTK